MPRKNLRALAGRPMIAYSIESALQSALFSEVYVCTEDEEIARVAMQYGATVPELIPQDLCGDMVPSHIPCQYIAARLPAHGKLDSLICLQPSSPLRSAQDIRDAVDEYSSGGYDFLVSVTPVDPHYFHWTVVPGEDSHWKMFFGTQYLKERTLLPPVYRPNGAIKIAKLRALATTGHFFGDSLGVVEIPEERSVHVALEFDLKVCETMMTR